MTTESLKHRSKSATQLHVAPLNAALGAEIRGIDLKRLDEPTFEAVHEAFLDEAADALSRPAHPRAGLFKP